MPFSSFILEEIILESLDDLLGHVVILKEPRIFPTTLHHFLPKVEKKHPPFMPIEDKWLKELLPRPTLVLNPSPNLCII